MKLDQAPQTFLRSPTKIPPYRHFKDVYEKVYLSAFHREYCRCEQPLINELHKQADKKGRHNPNDENDEPPSSANKKLKVIDEKTDK